MSFFDEADEPPETQRPRSAARPPRGRGRPPGGSGRPPQGHQQQVQTRRLIAGGFLLVVILAMVLLISSCESNKAKNSLKSYAANVNSLVHASNKNGKQMFSDLQQGQLNSDQISTLQSNLASAATNARGQLRTAKALSAPGSVGDAQSNLVTMMQLRLDGISQIADHIQDAASTNTSKDAVYDISVGTSMLYGSDVLYKTFVTTGIAKALNGSDIPIGGTTGAQINDGQIVTDLGWLNSTFIAEKIGAKLPTSVANTAGPGTGTHGHELVGVTVGGTALSSLSTNTVPASPAPTFTLSLTNSGTNKEYDVECEVRVGGLTDTGTSTIAETLPGQSYTCTVQLPSPPTPGTYPVTFRVVKVPGETKTSNNSLTFPVDFN